MGSVVCVTLTRTEAKIHNGHNVARVSNLMTLSDEARERLTDIVESQPTKNAELQERWGLESGSEVHQYLESELGEYYYRDDNSLICATPEAEVIVSGGDIQDIGPRAVSGSELDVAVLDGLPGPEEEPQSVVATLHAVRDLGYSDADVKTVRSSLHSLTDKGLVERVRKTVPTFRLALERESISIEQSDER